MQVVRATLLFEAATKALILSLMSLFTKCGVHGYVLPVAAAQCLSVLLPRSLVFQSIYFVIDQHGGISRMWENCR